MFLKRIFKILLIISFTCIQSAYCDEIQKSGVEYVDLSFEQAYQLMLENNNHSFYLILSF